MTVSAHFPKYATILWVSFPVGTKTAVFYKKKVLILERLDLERPSDVKGHHGWPCRLASCHSIYIKHSMFTHAVK